MGVSKAEVKLRRLLRAQVHQTSDAKLGHYVATMRSLLAELTGDPVRQDLATIPAAKAREYAQQVELVAEKLRGRVPSIAQTENETAVADTINPDYTSPSSWDSAQGLRTDVQSNYASPSPPAAQGLLSTTMRRRLRGDEARNAFRQEDGDTARVDAPLQSLVQRHRELQEGLTNEMVVLSAQLKEGSLLMDHALRDTESVLDSTEEAVEYSLAATNKANERVGKLSTQSWKTSCLTWLLLFMVFGMFMFMVVLIRIT